MRDAVIIDAVRTPVAKRNGSLASVHPADLSAHVLRGLIERTGLEPGLVDDVIWGCVSQVGEQAFDIARTAVLSAGWPDSVPGTTVDRQCGSSQQAIHFGAASLIAGHCDLVVAGGVESMSRVCVTAPRIEGQSPFGATYRSRFGNDPFPNQGISAELVAERWKLNRNQLDEYSLSSHLKAAQASDSGCFAAEILPIDFGSSRFSADEGIRRDSSLEKLAGLPARVSG